MVTVLGVIIALAAVVAMDGCKTKKDYEAIFKNPRLYSQTVHELNSVVMGNNFSPIVASRNYLYASVAAYEVIAAGYPGAYYSLAGQINGLKSVPKPDTAEKINFEFASLMAYCTLGESVTFPKGSMDDYIDSIKNMAKFHGMPSDVYENSLRFADTVSKAIMVWSTKDNYLQTRGMERYAVDTDDPSRWVPTPPMYADAAEPHWNLIRPLVLDSASQFKALPPPAFNIKDKNSLYYKQVQQILDSTKNLTDEQKHIADFWDDNPFKLNVNGHLMFATKKFSPPGHWMSIIGIAAEKANADFATTVYAYAKTAITLFDSFIQCWDEKYRHSTVRPETVINRSFDQNWQPYLQTPPFPEYTCGHSTGSSAAAEALTSVFGDNFSYTDTSESEFGIKSRSYHSFKDAAMENTYARFYGGLHFHPTCLSSNKYGKQIADLVDSRLKMKKGEKKS
ncbi:MAG: vanadium-dependent haloperoxidase [Bacteroidota bacterium]|nr:vanadium-dependent haloperoxidase [Bacteroidota bacterium]